MQSYKWFLSRVIHNQRVDLNRDDKNYTIGRGRDNFLKCLSLYVSRQHCVIMEKEEKLFIVDLKSGNGTYVNNTKIIPSREIPLEPGDCIGIGVAEVLDKDCFVYQLLQVERQPKQLLPSPSTSNLSVGVIILTDTKKPFVKGDPLILTDSDEPLKKEQLLSQIKAITKTPLIKEEPLSQIKAETGYPLIKEEPQSQIRPKIECPLIKEELSQIKANNENPLIKEEPQSQIKPKTEVTIVKEHISQIKASTEDSLVKKPQSQIKVITEEPVINEKARCGIEGATNSAPNKQKADIVAKKSELLLTGSPSMIDVIGSIKPPPGISSGISETLPVKRNNICEIVTGCVSNNQESGIVLTGHEVTQLKIGKPSSEINSAADCAVNKQDANNFEDCDIQHKLACRSANTSNRLSAEEFPDNNMESRKTKLFSSNSLSKSPKFVDTDDVDEIIDLCTDSENLTCDDDVVVEDVVLNIISSNESSLTHSGKQNGELDVTNDDVLQEVSAIVPTPSKGRAHRVQEVDIKLQLNDSLDESNLSKPDLGYECNQSAEHELLAAVDRKSYEEPSSPINISQRKADKHSDSDEMPATGEKKDPMPVPVTSKEINSETTNVVKQNSSCILDATSTDNDKLINRYNKSALTRDSVKTDSNVSKSSVVLTSTSRNNEKLIDCNNKSDSVKINTNNSLLLQCTKKQPVVRLERISSKYWQSSSNVKESSNLLELSIFSENSDTNYTLEDDIVVISDDEDVGNESIIERANMFTSDDLDIKQELVDDEDQNEAEESESDSEWFAKLSQTFLDEIEDDKGVGSTSETLKRSASEDSDCELFSPVLQKRVKRQKPLSFDDSNGSEVSEISTNQVTNVSIAHIEEKDSVDRDQDLKTSRHGSKKRLKHRQFQFSIDDESSNESTTSEVPNKRGTNTNVAQLKKRDKVNNEQDYDNFSSLPKKGAKQPKLLLSDDENTSELVIPEVPKKQVTNATIEEKDIVGNKQDSKVVRKGTNKHVKHKQPLLSSDENSIQPETPKVAIKQVNVNLAQVESRTEVINEQSSDAVKKDKNSKLAKLKEKSTPSSRRTLIIDAPRMPPRKHHRTSSTEVSTKATSKKNNDIENTHKSITSNSICDEKQSKQKRSRSGDLDQPSTSFSLSSKDKKSITDKRKEKLKAIAEQKKTELNSNNNANKVKAKARVKNTTQSRGDILVEDLVPSKVKKDDERSVSSKSKSSMISHSADINNLNSHSKNSSSTSNVNKVTNAPIVPSNKKISVMDLPRIPRLNDQIPLKTSKTTETSVSHLKNPVEMSSSFPVNTIGSGESSLPLQSINEMETTICIPETLVARVTATNSHSGILGPKHKPRVKKRVRFKDPDDLCQIRYIEIEDGAQLHPVASTKDAPLNRNATNHSNWVVPKSSLEDVIQTICNWNTKWLKEQKNLSKPPPCYGSGQLCPMLTSFSSYNDYYKVVNPLMLLELWAKLCNDMDQMKNQPRGVPHNVVVDQVLDTTATNSNIRVLKCHTLLSNQDNSSQHLPYIGDLCLLEVYLDPRIVLQDVNLAVVSDSQGNSTHCARIFAYIESVNKEQYYSTYNPRNNVPDYEKPTWKMNMVVKVKCKNYIQLDTKLRLTVLTNIRPDLRMFEAVIALSHCQLAHQILNPVFRDYAVPSIDISRTLVLQDNLNDSQKKAVLQSAAVCLAAKPNICLIQGPPGTGKSTVITNIIMQILYGKNQYQKMCRKRSRPRILLCAPSNAAVDEVVCRLLQIRQNLPKEDRFKMVRCGRVNMMKPLVKEISLEDLAKRATKQAFLEQEGLESEEIEIHNLEAKRRSYEMTLESAKQRQNSTANILNKIAELDKKLFQLRNRKQSTVTPSFQWQLERESQVKLLSGADIVASTLSSCFTSMMSEVFTSSGEGQPRFTCCIVDEATQCCEPEALIPLMLGINTFVLVGDPEQLQATVVSSEAHTYGYGQSLFRRISNKFVIEPKSPVQFLNVQYRMHPEICQWPNMFFYENRIHSAPMMENLRDSPLRPYVIMSLDNQLSSGETVNPKEARIVSQLALSIQNLGQQHLKVAIITPYHKQRAEISRLLQQENIHTHSNLEVNTIDSFQGQESDVVIFSCARTDGLGFMTDTQRLNVALTRARYSLIICGNFVSLRKDRTWRDLLDNAYKRSLKINIHCNELPNKDELLRLVLRRVQSNY